MDSFVSKFIEEAVEHINDLENALLELEYDSKNKELIETVFRSMHSLKGGSAMFGLHMLSNFTHHMENIYDLVRNDQISITKELLNITLSAVDHMKLLLSDDCNTDENILNEHEYLLGEIVKFASTVDQKISSAQAQSFKLSQSLTTENSKTVFISFAPNPDIFNNGTNPLYLIDELKALGKCYIIPYFDKIPTIDELDPTKCYIQWDIILSTKEKIDTISEVFIFVENDCKLEVTKLSDIDLLNNEHFVNELENNIQRGVKINASLLEDIARSLIQETTKPTEKPLSNKTTLTAKETTISSLRVASYKLDQLMNLVSELVTTQARLSLYSEKQDSSDLQAITENVQKLSRQLRDTAFSIVLIPIETMLTRFQRLVRDISNEMKKEVVFIAEGTETELDKTIIENLTDPLMHMIRNSLDHGIESPDIREKKGKPRQGSIILKAYHSGTNVHVQIIDDGAGIDPDMIYQKAISKKIIEPDTQLSKSEILDLIFLPGFSTAQNVTDVSGRGVGMDVVKRKISTVRGEIEISSEIDKGTTFTIKLPLTLSIIDGLLVKVHETQYIFPLSSIEKIFSIEHDKVTNTFNNTIILDGNQYPFFNLREEFGFAENTDKNEEIVLVRYENIKVGFVIDTVIGEYQAVLKPLGKYYQNQEIISGASILGDGSVALVVDTTKAVKHFSSQVVLNEEADV